MSRYSRRRAWRRFRRRHGRMTPVQQRFAAGIIAAAIIGGVAKHPHTHPPAAVPATTTAAAGLSNAGSRPVAGGEGAFIRAVLADMGAPVTSADTSSLAAWFPHEFPSWPPSAANNPMATTQTAAGSTTYNSAGVQNYPTAGEGAQATAATLGNGHYPGIAAALRAGRGLCGGGLASEFLTWSGSGYSSVC